MANYELTGTIKLIMETQEFSSGFTKREFVVTTDDDRYPQDIKFECIKEKCDLLNPLRTGDSVQVCFNVRGNAWKEKYYVNLQCWKIDTVAGSHSEPPPDVPAKEGVPIPDGMTDDDDGLPF